MATFQRQNNSFAYKKSKNRKMSLPVYDCSIDILFTSSFCIKQKQIAFSYKNNNLKTFNFNYRNKRFLLNYTNKKIFKNNQAFDK